MKRINIAFVSLLVLTIISSTGCKKFLERPPEGQMTKEEALKDEQGLLNFANGIYTLFGNGDYFGGRQQIFSELLGDQYNGEKLGSEWGGIYKRQNTFFGSSRNGYYTAAYRVINRSNIILDNLGLASTQRNFIEGQAKLFRGISHFELVRMFAQPYGFTAENSHLGIPLRTSVSLESQGRASVHEVYTQVISDLKAADSLLPADPKGGKFYTATKWAAKAYLAKVYFQMNNFAEAFNYANQVIQSNKFQLDPNLTVQTSPTDFSTIRFSEGLSKEGILVIANKSTPPAYEPGSDLRGNFRSKQGTPQLYLTDQFYTSAISKSADKRRGWYKDTLGLKVLTKYDLQRFDLPLVHLTEIKLIRAEAAAELGGANVAIGISDINDILTRAYGGTTFNLPSNASASLVISTVRNERELELVGEGQRIHEIKRIGARTGQNVDRRGSPWNCPGFILQFPKEEIDANAAFQLNPEGGCF